MSDKGLDNKNIPSDGGLDNKSVSPSSDGGSDNVKNVGKTSENDENPYTDPETGKFKPGNPGGGRPKGTRDWRTDFEEAIENVAKRLGKTKSEVRVSLLSKGLQKAMSGNARFWTYIIDRDYGKEPQPLSGDIDIPGAKEMAKVVQKMLENENISNKQKTKGGDQEDS